LYRLGRFDEASEAGTRVLEIKDRRCSKAAAMGWRLPKIAPRELATQPGKRNVIAYSLWGAQPAYLRGALQNLLRAPQLYPGWVLRYYVDATVPSDFIALIGQLGGEIVMRANDVPLREKLCWRFNVANDARAGCAVSLAKRRDAERRSVVSARSRLGVRAAILPRSRPVLSPSRYGAAAGARRKRRPSHRPG
jgi:hypothetical protein